MAVASAVAAPPTIDLSTLCSAFTGTLSSDSVTRQRAEIVLKHAELTPGLLKLLTEIISTASIPVELRSSAAIFLKNEVRRHWEASPFAADDDQKASTYGPAEKAAFRDNVVPLLEHLLTENAGPAMVNSLDECIRIITLSDFPEAWPTALNAVTHNLSQRMNSHAVLAALMVLRRMVAKYELKISKDRDPLVTVIRSTFPLLLSLTMDLCKANCFATTSSATMTKLICKIYWSATQIALADCPELPATLDAWMQVMEHIIATPVPNDVLATAVDLEARNALQQFKAKKWACQIVHSLLARHCSLGSMKRDEKKVQRDMEQVFVKNWAGKFVDLFAGLLWKQHAEEVWISDKMANVMLQYLAQSLELSSTYKKFKPHQDFLLFAVCFPLLCYSDDDVATWMSDPTDFIRSQVFCLTSSSRDSAVHLVQTLVRLRSRDSLERISAFVLKVLNEYNAAPPEAKVVGDVSKKKDGALYMTGAIAERLLSKKRNVDMETFLTTHVLPEFQNSANPFLRLRACWTYRQFLSQSQASTTFKDIKGLVQALLGVLELCADKELPVRSEAAVTLQAFVTLEIPEIRQTVVDHMAVLMERVFETMTLVQENELIVQTLEAVVLEFNEYIPPYAVHLVRSLSAALVRMIDVVNNNEEESPSSAGIWGANEDMASTAMSVAQTIVSVLCTLDQPQFYPLYIELVPSLMPVLDKMLAPEGLDFLDNGLVLLTYLTFYSPNLSSPHDLWKYFERMYQTVCGGSSQHLQLTGVCEGGWAPDYLGEMLAPLDNMMSRDMARFASATPTSLGLTYKQMFLKMCEKAILGLGDPELSKSGIELMMLAFESHVNTSNTFDDMMVPCFQLLLQYLQGLDTTKGAKHLYGLPLRLISTVLLYNPDLFFQVADSSGKMQELLRLYADLGIVKSYHGKKIVLLALVQLFDWCRNGRLPQSAAAELIANLEKQLKAVIECKRKADQAEEEDNESDSDDWDSEEDIGEDEDAKTQLRDQLLRRLQLAQEHEEEDSEDSDDEDYEEASTDGLLKGDNPVDNICELDVMSTLISASRDIFVATLGADATTALVDLIGAERARRATVSASTTTS